MRLRYEEFIECIDKKAGKFHDLVLEASKNAHLFIMDHTNETPYVPVDNPKDLISIPFDSIWIESTEGIVCPLFPEKGMDSAMITGVLVFDSDIDYDDILKERFSINIDTGEQVQSDMKLNNIGVHYMFLVRRPDGSPMPMMVRNDMYDLLVSVLVNTINSERLFKSDEQVKVRGVIQGEKFKRVIRDIIYVGSHSKQSVTGFTGRRIEYSHRFEVRGHWRKLPQNRIGKDRDGHYRVIGRTWVKAFQKGDKALPLIKKIRVVTNSGVTSEV